MLSGILRIKMEYFTNLLSDIAIRILQKRKY